MKIFIYVIALISLYGVSCEKEETMTVVLLSKKKFIFQRFTLNLNFKELKQSWHYHMNSPSPNLLDIGSKFLRFLKH